MRMTGALRLAHTPLAGRPLSTALQTTRSFSADTGMFLWCSTGISLTDSVLKQRFGVNLGISQRKSLLNSLSERDAAREAEEYGFSPSAGMPGGADNHAPRRCMSLSDATMATGQSSSDDEVMPQEFLTHTLGLCSLVGFLDALPTMAAQEARAVHWIIWLLAEI